jgi:hypothetical protein
VEGDICLTIEAVVIRLLVLIDVKEVDVPHETSLLVSPRPFFGALKALALFMASSHLFWREFYQAQGRLGTGLGGCSGMAGGGVTAVVTTVRPEGRWDDIAGGVITIVLHRM